MQYQSFYKALNTHSDKALRFVLPNSQRVPNHFHITDVGSVVQNFMDCGGEVREERYVQIQLWLGADKGHRLSAVRAAQILEQSQPVLSLLPNLEQQEVVIEYQTDLVSQYTIGSMVFSEDELFFVLKASQTQCLAALRHQSEFANACCSGASCCA